MNAERYREVLNQLDSEDTFEKMNFPHFGDSFRFIDSRLSVFADEEHWSILIEAIEVNLNNIGHHRNLNLVFSYGNYIRGQLGLTDERSFFVVTSDGDDGPVFGKNDDCVNPKVHTMRIRGHIVPVPHDLKIYESKGIKLINKDKIYPEELLRALTPEYREDFFLSEEEKQTEFKEHIPLLLQLEDWRHPLPLEDGRYEKPSECETFQLIAKVIAECNPDLYKPTENPNTHWISWMVADMYL